MGNLANFGVFPSLLFVIAIIIPGYVCWRVSTSEIITSRTRNLVGYNLSIIFISSFMGFLNLFFSMVIFFIAGLFSAKIDSSKLYNLFGDKETMRASLDYTSFWLLSFFILLSPFLTGLICKFFLTNSIKHNGIIAKAFRFTEEQQLDFASDRFFMQKNDGMRLYITLDNDEVIIGDFGKTSFISSNLSQGDIYLEKSYILDENGDMIMSVHDKENNGVWIKGENIVYIEAVKAVGA